MASYYPGLKYLNSADYRTGNIHPLLKVKCSSSIEISRIPPTLKIITGTYILQTIRTKIYGDEDAIEKVRIEAQKGKIYNFNEITKITECTRVPVVLLSIVDISHLRHHTFLFE
jgi:hypothetical protein